MYIFMRGTKNCTIWDKKNIEYIILYMHACFLQKRLVDEFSGGNFKNIPVNSYNYHVSWVWLINGVIVPYETFCLIWKSHTYLLQYDWLIDWLIRDFKSQWDHFTNMNLIMNNCCLYLLFFLTIVIFCKCINTYQIK